MQPQEFSSRTNTQRAVFNEIRNYLAGRLVGATRDRTLLEEVVKALFSRSHLTHRGGIRGPVDGGPTKVGLAYHGAYQELQRDLPELFPPGTAFQFDDTTLRYVDSKIHDIDVRDLNSDPLGDAFQVFIGSEVRGNEGQFFTPVNAVQWIVEAVDPGPGERVIDPACGAGSFLHLAAKYLAKKGVSESGVAASIYGIEKDQYLASLAAKHVGLITLRSPNIVCGDSLAFVGLDGRPIPDEYRSNFDVVIANPPFGAKIISASDDVRRLFSLAYKHRRTPYGNIKTSELSQKTPPQILFVERIVSLLSKGGRAGIVLPESLVSSSKTGHVVDYIRETCDIQAVVGMPESLFKTSGKGGTHTKTCLLVFRKKGKGRKVNGGRIYIAETKWCGHDSRGNVIPHDDLPTTLAELKAPKSAPKLGRWMAEDGLKESILAPRYYNPEGDRLLDSLKETHDLITFRDLVDDQVIDVSVGVEVGKLAYGQGDIPFVRTSDISNWEIKLDPKHCVSNEVYEQNRRKAAVMEGDILMVKDGTYLIGACAFVTKYDERILFQSHLYRLRVLRPDVISPHMLLAVLSSPPVQSQIKSKQFTQDIIDSLGARLYELVLPIPRDLLHRRQIETLVAKVIDDRVEARELARRARLGVADPTLLDQNMDETGLMAGQVMLSSPSSK